MASAQRADMSQQDKIEQVFLSAFFDAMAGTPDPYSEIGKYLDDGPQSIHTGTKAVQMNGQTLYYGPDLKFTKTTTPERVIIQFSEPIPKASLTSRCNASVLRIELDKSPPGAYAVGEVAGFQQRKKLTWGE